MFTRSTFAACALLLTGTSVAHASTSTTGHFIFAASEIDVDHPAGALVGTLDVSVFANGNVSGYYRPADSGSFIEVLGAVDDGRIYLDIGNERPIVGTFDGAEIVGYRDFGNDRYRFKALRTEQPPT
jgi:hypothetical protein